MKKHTMKNTWILEEGTGNITESPDNGVNGQSYTSSGAIAFGYYRGKIVVSDFGETHVSIVGIQRESFKYPGRYWGDTGVLSFWEYPKSASDLKKLVKDLNEAISGKYYYKRDGSQQDRYTPKEVIKIANGYSSEKFNAPGPAANFLFQELNWDVFGGDQFKKHLKKITSSTKIEMPFKFPMEDQLIPDRRLDSDWDDDPDVDVMKLINTYKHYDGWLGKGSKRDSKSNQPDHVKPAMAKTAALKKMNKSQKKQMYDYFANKGKLDPGEQRMYAMMQRREDVEIYIDPETQTILLEAPHFEVNGQVIDLEFEKDKGLTGLKRIIKILLKKEAKDKYGSSFQLKSDSDISEFTKKILKNSQVQRMLKET